MLKQKREKKKVFMITENKRAKKMSFVLSKNYCTGISCLKKVKDEIPKEEISNNEEPTFSFSFSKPIPTPLANINASFRCTDKTTRQTVEQKKLLAKQRRLERSLERQQTKHDDKMTTLTYKSLNLSQQVKETKQRVRSLKEEVYNTEGRVPVERRNLLRKLKAIATLEKKFDDYKVYIYIYA